MTNIAPTPRDASRPARATLLTVLGEAVLPVGGRVWQESLVAALEAVGTSASAARQVVARAARDGWLTGERVGRRSLMTVTPDTRARLEAARKRLARFGGPSEWDGRWLVVMFSVPEERRDQRYQIRSQLSWLGFGPLWNGVWISPHTERQDAAWALLNSGPDGIDKLMFVAAPVAAHDPRAVARMAWDLDELRVRYMDFQRTYSRARPTRPAAVFGAWIRLITAWRQFPTLDPELPDSLLSANWPRQSAYETFLRRSAEWEEPSLEYFRSLNVI